MFCSAVYSFLRYLHRTRCHRCIIDVCLKFQFEIKPSVIHRDLNLLSAPTSCKCCTLHDDFVVYLGPAIHALSNFQPFSFFLQWNRLEAEQSSSLANPEQEKQPLPWVLLKNLEKTPPSPPCQDPKYSPSKCPKPKP